jgi:hypothetical protein
VQFSKLWASYPSGHPYVDASGRPPKGFENQCAIKLSAAIHGAGIEMKSYIPAHVDVQPDGTIGRILLDGNFAATRADELASWLKRQPFCGLPQKPEDVTGKDWEKNIKGRTGIVYFADYWMRNTDKKKQPSGDHIDLWNGSSLTPAPVNHLRSIGLNSISWLLGPLSRYNFSDLAGSSQILFWEVR